MNPKYKEQQKKFTSAEQFQIPYSRIMNCQACRVLAIPEFQQKFNLHLTQHVSRC